MKTTLVEALSDCLERIEGGAPPAEALRRFPELRPELEPLVAAALAVRSLPPRPVRPAFRDRVAGHVARLEEERQRAVAPWYGRLTARLRFRRGALASRAVAGVVVALLVLGYMVVVSADSQPGDPLYPVRQVLERVWPVIRYDRRPGAPVGAPGTDERQHGIQPPDVAGTPLAAQPPATAVLRRANPDLREAPTLTPVHNQAPAQPVSSLAPHITALPTAATVSSTPSKPPPAPADEPAPTATEHWPTAPPTPDPTSTAAPSPTPPPVTPTGTPRPGSVTIGGSVKQGDQTSSRPLPGAAVSLYRKEDVVCHGDQPEPTIGPASSRTTTDAEGAYRFTVSPGEYLVAAEGGPECLPSRWHVGPFDPGASNACGASIITLLEDGQSTQFTNILYAESVGCPTATPPP